MRKVYPDKGGLARGVACRGDIGKLEVVPRFERESNTGVLTMKELKLLAGTFKAEIGELSTLTPTFAQLATQLMEKKRWNAAIFTEQTHLDKTAYSRITNNKAKNVTLRTVAAFCVGVCATKDLADKLFEAAGYSVCNEAERFVYSFLVTHMHGRTIDEASS